MIARAVLLGLAATTAATSTITIDCTNADGSLSAAAANVVSGSAFVRVSLNGDYTDLAISCVDGTEVVDGASENEIEVPAGATITFLNRANLAFEKMTDCAIGGTAATSLEVCQFTPTADGTVTLIENTNRNTIYDCAQLTMPVSGFLFERTTPTMMGTAADMFTCSRTAVTTPTALMAETVKPATDVGLFGIDNAATSDTFVITSDGMNTFVVKAPVEKVLSSDATSTCMVGEAVTTEGCEIVDGTMGSFNVELVGGAVPVADPNAGVPCTFRCTSVGNVPGAGCTSSSSTTTSSLCQGQATTVVTTPCVEGRTQGEVFCFPRATSVNFAQADFDALFAAFVNSPNSNAAFFSFIGVLRAQGFTFAFGTTCVACAVETLSSGGFVLCADCGVLLAGSAAARQGAGVRTGVRVVICGSAGTTEAERTSCLEAAACAGVLENAACFRAGVAFPCPMCMANIETTSSSKKGLLGLLGLLAIIPAVLLLCSSILCCCLLLRRRKRAVPPPVIPTVAPMTSVCEPVVCGGTIGAAPMGCSPYGSAYPVM